MDVLKVERLGGIAGFGGPHLRSDGALDLSQLAPGDRAKTERLFGGDVPPPEGAADGFRYRLTRADGRTVEAPESAVPQAVRACVSDRLD